MRLVILESPYSGDIARNTVYARRAMADSIKRGEAPLASHLLYTQPGILDENKPEERKLGIECGFAWGEAVRYHGKPEFESDTLVVFYTDYGWSQGMVDAMKFYCIEHRFAFEERNIGRNEE